ncbi:MAG TPA: peptide chain release factor N(5)-glutamine methyltransferase [Gammaproteobacteria bacterium]|nr:peptide chain release factor N(5)-glutamine methyltransferase [Gammaproteobacteria bacterium]
MIVQEALEYAQTLLAPSSESPRLDAELLLGAILDCDRTALHIHQDRTIAKQQSEAYLKLIQQRQNRMPIAYLLEEKEFWSLSFKVTPDTLIPRPATETLIEVALENLPPKQATRILELGTGSGIIATVLAMERNQSYIVATDISVEALKIAKYNASVHQCSAISFLCSDWYSALNEVEFDLIASNPPYISHDHECLLDSSLTAEPLHALEAGKTGLDALKVVIPGAVPYLKTGGILIVEHGYDQQSNVQYLFHQAGFTQVRTVQDLQQQPRITIGQK